MRSGCVVIDDAAIFYGGYYCGRGIKNESALLHRSTPSHNQNSSIYFVESNNYRCTTEIRLVQS